MSGRRKSPPYKIVTEEHDENTLNIQEEGFENISDVSSEYSDNSVECKEEYLLSQTYQMMLLRILLRMNEKNREYYQDTPLDLTTHKHKHHQINTQPSINNMKQTQQKQKYKNTKQSIKRPMNAFMIWAKKERGILQEREPSLSNCSISKILGRRWKEMEQGEKQFYFEQQAVLAQRHKETYPDYKYRPRQRRNKTREGELKEDFKEDNRI